MTRIKICGIKREEDALAVANAGADFIGLVFAESPRQITTEQAKEIVAALKNNKSTVETVGVFVNTPVTTVNSTADNCNLDRVQLSGDESWEYCQEIVRPVIKVIRVSQDQNIEQLCRGLSDGLKQLDNQNCMFHIDSTVRDKYGGTGRTFDWNLAKPIAAKFPVIVAGGLTPENVAEAIKIISPWGVDVSSGVETKGVKDMDKVRKFIEAVREADND